MAAEHFEDFAHRPETIGPDIVNRSAGTLGRENAGKSQIVGVHGHMHERGREFRAWVDRAGQTLPLLDTAAWNEPTRTAETLLHADPVRTCDALAAAIERR